MRLGLPTSSAPSGVIVAALRPKRASAIASAAAGHDLVVGLAPVLEREVVVLELHLDLGHAGIEHAQRLLQQLLAGLVALEDDDAQGRAESPAMAAQSTDTCTWCGAAIEPGDGWRLQELPGARRAAFCRLEHVVPWAMRGAHWEPGEDEPGARAIGVRALRRAARRRPAGARAPPRRAPRARRILLGRPPGRLGEVRRTLG